MSPAPSRFDLPERLSRYQIGPVIGFGGFAVVVRAYDEGLATDVAIKVLHRARALDPEIRERFVQEARLLRRVRDASVVTVHDVGETPDSLPYFVMDLAAGGVLEDRLTSTGGATTTEAHPADLRAMVTTLADGLGALHAANVVHRDVKPSNLLILRAPGAPTAGPRQGRLLGDGERLVIGDLGLAKDQDLSVAGPTMVGGTPRFQAPEQTELGARVDARTDVYASTAVLWRVLTGGLPPLPDELPVALLGVPERWRATLARGLAVRPDERFASMSEWGAVVLDLIGDGGSETVRAAAAGVTCPYKGLAAFQADDAPLFFGRAELIDHLVSRLQARPVLMIGGPSGSGKSSLLRAGLLPALAAGALPGSQMWASCLFTPGTHPLDALDARLARLPHGSPAIVAIDQLEELFTSCGRDEREAFLAALEALTAADPAVVRVVMAVRADFYGSCAAHPWLASVINANQVLVGPLTRPQLRTAIEAPARRVGLRLEDGLPDRILDDAGGDVGTLPLVAHALVETWVRRQGTLLTLAGYQAAGGVTGAIGRTADEVWEHMDPSQRQVARRLLLRLVRTGDGVADSRRLVTWAELGEAEGTRNVVSLFAESRLLTVDDQGVELAHEALIRTWPRLAGWLEESRDELRGRERVEAAAMEWERQGRDPDLLYRGTPLAAALDWRAGLAEGDGLTGESAEYLAAAEAARDDERRAADARQARSRRARRRATSALAGLTALALVASLVASVALAGSRRDARAVKEQLAHNLAALAMEQRSSDPLLATMLATEAMARVSPSLLAARQALVESRVALGGARLVPFGDPIHVGDALTAVVDPAGRQAVTGNRDGSVGLWDLASHEETARLTGPRGGIQEAAFGPDGSWLVAASDDGGVWRWSLDGRGEPGADVAGRRLADLESIVWSVAVSPDGSTVAAATQGGQVWLLDAVTGAKQGEPVGARAGDFDSVAFAPDGTSLLAGTGSGEVYVWSLPSRLLRYPPVAAHTSEVWELVVRRDRPELLTVSSDGTARRWDLDTGARLPGGPYDGSGSPDAIKADAVNAEPSLPAGATLADGGRLVSLGGGDGRVYTWSFDEGRFVDVAGAGSPDAVIDASRSADGTTLVTLAGDQTLRVWSQRDRPGAFTTTARVDAAAYAIDVNGGAVAVGTGAGDVVVLDAATGAERTRLSGHQGRVFAVAFAGPNRLVTGDEAGTLREWDATTGRLLATVTQAHRGAVSAVAASDRHGLVASAGADGVMRLWSAAGLVAHGQPLGALPAPLTDVAFSGDGTSVVASTTSGQVARWSTGGKAIGLPFTADDNTVWAVALSPDGQTLAAATADEVVSLWSLAGSEPVKVRELGAHEGGALDVAFLDDATLAATSRSGDVRLWDVATGQAIGPPLVGAGSPVWHLSTAPDGSVWTASQAGDVVRIDALVPEAACALAAASFDAGQRQRLLGGQEPAACPRP